MICEVGGISLCWGGFVAKKKVNCVQLPSGLLRNVGFCVRMWLLLTVVILLGMARKVQPLCFHIWSNWRARQFLNGYKWLGFLGYEVVDTVRAGLREELVGAMLRASKLNVSKLDPSRFCPPTTPPFSPFLGIRQAGQPRKHLVSRRIAEARCLNVIGSGNNRLFQGPRVRRPRPQQAESSAMGSLGFILVLRSG